MENHEESDYLRLLAIYQQPQNSITSEQKKLEMNGASSDRIKQSRYMMQKETGPVARGQKMMEVICQRDVLKKVYHSQNDKDR